MNVLEQVTRIVNRGEKPLGPRVTVLLTLLVGTLSIITGITNIGSVSVVGPLAAVIPLEIQRAAGFTGALTGFFMFASAFGLRQGYRAAWYSTVALLPLTALQGLLQSSPWSAPLVVLSIIALPNAIYNRNRFRRSLSLTSAQLGALIAIAGVQAYGTVGSFALRDEFQSIETLVDAFYYTLVTASTVGYGDAVPMTQAARLFGLSVVLLGTTSFAIALGTLLGPLLEARFARALGRMTERNYELLEDHVLILGYGELTDAVLDLIDGSGEYVIITDNKDHASTLSQEGIDVFIGSPSDEAPLIQAGINRAKTVLVATNDDGDDALAILTARELNPSVRIVSAATKRENIEKLRRAGADTVISPIALGAEILVQSSFYEKEIDEIDSDDLIDS
jgi:voltage-gated potassium channel